MFLVLASGRQMCTSVLQKTDYSTEQVPEQPYLHREVVSGKKDKEQNKTKKKKKKMNEWLWSS